MICYNLRSMVLESGSRLGHYEVLAPLGVGGMGEVYRARDTKLGRDVAIKVLPEGFSRDKERLARFEREARLLAQLNHANIATLHGLEESDGQPFLVMELVEGETLAERIARGPIPVDEAMPLFIEIAEGLEAAHEKGIIHRDLKPANVKISPDGKPKILDFGLAKAFAQEGNVSAEMSQSPTLTRGTALGVIMGTAAYMSPEQARGKKLDKRTDVWAFACCLYEALTGRKVFEAEDVSLTLAEVMKSEPQWDALPIEVPASLLVFLKRCLEKDPNERVRDIGDVRLAMKGAFESGGVAEEVTPQPTVWRPFIGIAAAAALTLSVITGLAVWSLSTENSSPRRVTRSSLPLPPGVALTGGGGRMVALSRDGSRLVYSANDQLYFRALDESEATPIRGTEGGARRSFLSPDGEQVGFWVDGQIRKVAIGGGAPIRVCEAERLTGASWGVDDSILFGQRGIGILRVSASGGTPEVLIPLEHTSEVGWGPHVLPGEKAVLFTVGDGSNWDVAKIVVHSLETGARKVLIEGGKSARYLSSGHLVYVSEGTLLAVPFDVERLEVMGGPVPVAEGVTTGVRSGAAQFSVSDTGSLVHVTGNAAITHVLVWVDRRGNEEVLNAEPRFYNQARISPDGSSVALGGISPGDVWSWDFARETMTRLTFAPALDGWPVWTPDGRRLVFSSRRDGALNLYSKAADGTGAVERLTEAPSRQYANAFTPDGNHLLYHAWQPSGGDLVVLSLDGGASEPLLATEFDERNVELSPNGKWLAYESDASGQYEIHVRPYPNVDRGHWQISEDGGTRPLWAPDGRELFYLAYRGELMKVRVQTERSFEHGNAELLLPGNYYVSPTTPNRTYDISPDGERFLMVKEAPGQTSTAEVILVQNWFQELERLVPTEN